MKNKRKGFYSISVVAKMFSVHQQTIRMYEKEGLITPKRSEGNTRLFSEEDVDRLEEIIHLTHKMGVNLAGVEVILKLQKKVTKLQEEMNKLLSSAQEELHKETDFYKSDIKKNAERLLEIKKENQKKQHVLRLPTTKQQVHEQSSEHVEDWEIDYDEKDE